MNRVLEKRIGQVIEGHRKDPKTPLLLAAWYATRDPTGIYLLEVCRGVVNPGDASWDTFEFQVPPSLRSRKRAKLFLTYISPEEFFDALDRPKSPGYERWKKIHDDHRILFVLEKDPEARSISRSLDNGQTASR